MKSAQRERSAIELVEEAVHLLRRTPLSDFAWYFGGVLPFLLGLLYFWMEMSWNAFAYQHRSAASFGMALLFAWMKCAQSVFCRKLRTRCAGERAPRLTVGTFGRIAVLQALIQPTKLFIWPAALLATLPFGWVTAFYENATVVGDDESARLLCRRAWRMAAFWPRQNHLLLAICSVVLLLVFANIAIVTLTLPELLRAFTGVETIFTRGGVSILNSTFFAIIGALTYLVCDPLLKAVYVLRCFYCDAQRSGVDLLAEIRALPRVRTLAAALLIAAMPLSAPAAPERPLTPPAAELNDAIERTAARDEFTWKLPRQSEAAQPEKEWPLVNAIERFLKATGRLFKRGFDALDRLLAKLFRRPSAPLDASGTGAWQTSSRTFTWLLLVVLGGFLVVIIAATVREFGRRRRPVAVASLSRRIDLESADVTADQLPEDEWLQLGRQHLAKGETRLALRAFFLAGLAHLGAREVLALARHKSNREYQRELRRRAADRPPLLAAFGENVAAVERAWYGRHRVDADGVARFEENLEQIRAG